MRRLILMFLFIVTAPCGAAEALICYNAEIMNSAYVATFQNVDLKKDVSVSLAIPIESTTIESFKGTCNTDSGVSHFRTRCQVSGSRGDLFLVTLAAVGGKRFVATATQMGVDENPFPLPICK